MFQHPNAVPLACDLFNNQCSAVHAGDSVVTPFKRCGVPLLRVASGIRDRVPVRVKEECTGIRGPLYIPSPLLARSL